MWSQDTFFHPKGSSMWIRLMRHSHQTRQSLLDRHAMAALKACLEEHDGDMASFWDLITSFE